MLYIFFWIFSRITWLLVSFFIMCSGTFFLASRIRVRVRFRVSFRIRVRFKARVRVMVMVRGRGSG